VFGGKLSRDGEFFDLFGQISDLCVRAAKEFRTMCDQPEQVEAHTQNIKAMENAADEITHRAIELVHKTFITPIDRDDIYQLISKLDDVIDFIDAASQRVFFYQVGKLNDDVKHLADIVVSSCVHVKNAVSGLKNLKKPQEILAFCVEINRLENDADHAMREGIGKLFRDEADTRRLIKLKEVFELLEVVTDRTEDVANVLESIVLEYA
jgi:uncharacterized protein